MTELGGLLELLYSAPGDYRAVQGVLRHRSNFRLSHEAFERWEERSLREKGRSGGASYTLSIDQGQPPEQHELLVRFWSEPPDRLREEEETLAPAPNQHVTVCNGGRWWTYSPDQGAVSNVGAGDEAQRGVPGTRERWSPLLEPRVLIPVLELELRGEAEVLGRSVLRLGARLRELRGHERVSFAVPSVVLAVGADEYELLVDMERGMVLRAAALLGGEEFFTSSFEELVFDPELPPDIFVFEPPPDKEIRGPDMARHETLTIEEAARRASFRVFYVPQLPGGRWNLVVTYQPQRERPLQTDWVFLDYRRADAVPHVSVTQRPAEGAAEWLGYVPPGIEVEELERDGRTFTIGRPEPRDYGMPLVVHFVREGTAIALSSHGIEEELLLEFARSLQVLAPE
jgi:outer membrane lipoprotein-sorting protein